MKNVVKLFGIIALIAIIGFGIAACDNGNNNTGDPDLSGTITISPTSATVSATLTATYTGSETVTYQWKNGSTALGTATTQVASTAGSYTVTVSASGYKSKTSAAVSVTGGNGNGNATVAASFRFRNAATNAAISPSLNMRAARSVTGPGGINYEVDDESFEDYNWFYNTYLGGDTKKVGTGITPTKFAIPVELLKLRGDGIEAELIGTEFVTNDPVKIVDFAQGVTIQLSNIEPGTYKEIEFRLALLFALHNGTYYYPEIAFALPAAMNDKVDDQDFLLKVKAGSPGDPPINHTTLGGTKIITAPLSYLTPLYVEAYTFNGAGYTPTLVPAKDGFNTLLYTGNKYKLYAQYEYTAAHPTLITVPFEPVVIPEGAASVIFEIRWDLTNVIQQYTGRKYTPAMGENPATVEVDDTSNDGNDIFVLKNKFWEGFSITATVN